MKRKPPVSSHDILNLPAIKRSKTAFQVPEGISDPSSCQPTALHPQSTIYTTIKSFSPNKIIIANRRIIVPVVNISQLKKDNEQLRQENLNLRRQVSLFKQLFRNPERLKSVLTKLNER